MAAQRGEDAYVTLLLSDNYLPGALVLAHSLRDAGTRKKLAVMITLDSVSAEVAEQLKAVYDYVLPVPRIRNAKPANLYLMNRADLHSAFTKINLWKQTMFRKIVYLDADVVAYRAVDELFDLPQPFSAAPDVGWPDLFNTGVMVLTPNMGDYYAMTAMAERGISFDGADQGLLNMHFKNNYNRLSFSYNVTPSAHYSYVPAYRHFQSGINMVHFIGSDKPWAQGRSASAAGDSPYGDMLGRWWAVYDRHYRQPSPPQTPTHETEEEQPKVPEIVQYFVKGEFKPPTTTYVVPTGEPPLHEGRSTDDAFQAHPPSHAGSHDEGQSQDYPRESGNSYSATAIEGMKTETGEEQVSGPPSGVPTEYHEERRHEPEPPQMQPSWDAQRFPPPADSKPEAANFPQTHYTMSSDPAPWVPPKRYPSPPRNMWYEVPREKPAATEKPPPIFPWESQKLKPTRVFADEPAPSEPEPSVTDGSTVATSGEESTSGESRATLAESLITESSEMERKSEPDTPTTPTVQVTPSDPWASFTRVNAWDDDPKIGKYVDNMPLYRRHRSQSSIVGQTSPGSSTGPAGDSAARSQQDTSAGAEWQRRGSKLTDFPTAVDRPSLPVTPAPIRRPKFWGAGAPGVDEDEDDDKLPAAPGVPRQNEWDPVARLQLLAKQQSELLLQKLGSREVAEGDDIAGSVGIEGHDIPNRPLPFGSDSIVSPTYVPQSAPVHSPQPVKPPGVGPRGILKHGQEEIENTPRATSTTDPADKPAEPSYHGPGAMWEKEESYAQHSTAMPPSEEERDVLET